MKKTIRVRVLKTALIVIGSVLVLWLCAPVGGLFMISSWYQYRSIEPRKVVTLEIPDTEVAISLYTKQKPRAVFYEGAHQILEAAHPSQSNLYFSLLSTSAGNNTSLTAYWHPSDQCIRIVDSDDWAGETNESLLFLDREIAVHINDGGWDTTVVSEPIPASAQMEFPEFNESHSMMYSEMSESEFALPQGDGLLVGILRPTETTASKTIEVGGNQQPPNPTIAPEE